MYSSHTISTTHEDDWPNGLVLYEGILTKELQSILFNRIDRLPYMRVLSRDVQHYGYFYDYSIREPIIETLKTAPNPPTVLGKLADIFVKYELIKNPVNQIIVNKYLSGQGIAAHRDHAGLFDRSIGTLSLGSDYIMHFKHHKSHPNFDSSATLQIDLKSGSLLVFSDEARMHWTHEIKKAKTDRIMGKKRTRGVRISITFRNYFRGSA